MNQAFASTEATSTDAVDLAGWHLDARLSRLTRDSLEVRLEPRTMQVLVCLLRSHGEPVTRDALMQAVWGHEYVTDDALNRAISRLRKVLAKELDQAASIETIPKVGYRLTVKSSAEAGIEANGSRTRRKARWTMWFSIAAVLAVAVGVGVYANRPKGLLSGASIRVRPLTSLPGSEIEAALSPDGGRVAFVWRKNAASRWRIYVQALDSPSRLRISNGPGDDLRPVWSPDGNRIAFVRRSEAECEVLVVSALGGTPRHAAACNPAHATSLDWAPTGDALALTAPGQRGLSLVPLHDGRPRLLTHPSKAVAGDLDPVFSPDGQSLAFIRARAMDVDDLYVIPTAGGTARRLTHDNRSIAGVTWSADGRFLIFASNRGGMQTLWRVDARGGSPQRINAPTGNAEMPAMSRDGRHLVYTTCACQTDLFSLDLRAPATPPRQITATTRWDWKPQVSPSGKRIAFASTRSGAMEIWTADRDGSHPLRLTHFNGPLVSNPAWSPDGRAIVFDAAAADGNIDIYRISADGGPPRRMTSGRGNDRFPHFSPDGRWLYFSARHGGQWNIWRMPAAGGKASQITFGGGFFAWPASDGSVYFSRVDESGVWHQVIGGQPRMVVSDLAARDDMAWTMRDGRLWYIRRGPKDTPVLAVYDPASGQSRQIVALPRTLASGSGISVSPDGKLIFADTVRVGADLMLISRKAADPAP
ncbi:MAG TPA: winged helix-turn-helix domain-containing protein [Gammaproteobacteria bacterium]|nr:winged helix-turn-helix domain-containing protein [Gammaproteobacteria bacterium]